jgi:hypothetical protein
MTQLIHDSKIVPCVTITAGAAGTTAITGSTIDFAGYKGGLIIVQTGAIVTGAATSIKFEHSDNSDMSSSADVAGTAQTIADDDDNEVFYIDVSRPQKRYGRLLVSRATQNATVSAVAVLYGSTVAPVTQATGVTGETHVGKAAGTA